MPELTYLSLGWGVQSWTIAAMAALEELPPVDVAIHSDTGHEAAGTYAHAEKWTSWLEEHGVPVVTVKPENNSIVREDWGKKSGTLPQSRFQPSRSHTPQGGQRRQRQRRADRPPVHPAMEGHAHPETSAKHPWHKEAEG